MGHQQGNLKFLDNQSNVNVFHQRELLTNMQEVSLHDISTNGLRYSMNVVVFNAELKEEHTRRITSSTKV